MTPEFQKALFRLTCLYVLILMTLALICSAWLLGVAGREIRTTLDEAYGAVIVTGVSELGDESRERLQQSIIFFNIFVFGAGTLASYMLAKRTLRTIEQNNRAQQEFVTDASHELRTPLTALKAELQLAQRQAKTITPSEYNAVLGSALEEVSRLSTLSERLLQLASARSQSTKAVSSSAAALSVACKQLRAPTAAKQLKIVVPEEDATLQITHTDLTEVLVILLDNAVKYSPKGGTITVRQQVHDGEAVITVQDQGPGISSRDLPHVFERFYRGKASQTSAHGGHGIGLAVARKLVLAAGGNIHADNQPGSGALIALTLRTAHPSV